MKSGVLAPFALLLLVLFASGSTAQEKKKSQFQEVYTGTIVSMNGGLASTGFNLSIKDFTSDEDAQRYLAILAEGDQLDVLKKIRDLELGRLSPTGHVGRTLLVVRKTQLPDGKIRIVAAFERWQRIAEVRGGYRSQDYPFGLMEIILDAKGRKGSGTFIAACKIDLKRDKKTGKYQLELENFGTYPHKVMGAMRRN
jgi:hypothetical protein